MKGLAFVLSVVAMVLVMGNAVHLTCDQFMDVLGGGDFMKVMYNTPHGCFGGVERGGAFGFFVRW